MPRQENTKEKILQCAFGLFSEPRMSEISLSEIAGKAGISKTAIFRHYKNKEALLDKMRQSFFEALSQMLSELGSIPKPHNQKTILKTVRSVFDFNDSHPNYLNYFLQMSFTDELLTEGVNLLMQDNGINVINEDVFKDPKNYSPKNLLQSFFEQTLLDFLILSCGHSREFTKINDYEEYKDALAKLIYSGLGKKKNPISARRKKELDKICEIQLAGDEASNRFLDAFVNLIQESKTQKITVEKIASALGMAKSSVYSFFANKQDYLLNMLFQETERVNEILFDKCREAKNADEALYIVMKAQSNYFALRPQVIMLHGYFIFQENALEKKSREELQKKSREFLEKNFLNGLAPDTFDFPVSNNSFLFVKWISGLTVAFMLAGTRYKFPPEWTDFYVGTIFEMIECGIKSVKVDGE